MTQRAQVAYHQVVQVEQEDGIAPTLLAARVVRERPDAGNKDAPRFIFAGAVDHFGVALYSGHRVVVGVIVADGDDVCLLARVAQAKAFVEGVSDYEGIFALQPERCMTQPNYLCHKSSFLAGHPRQPQTPTKPVNPLSASCPKKAHTNC